MCDATDQRFRRFATSNAISMRREDNRVDSMETTIVERCLQGKERIRRFNPLDLLGFGKGHCRSCQALASMSINAAMAREHKGCPWCAFRQDSWLPLTTVSFGGEDRTAISLMSRHGVYRSAQCNNVVIHQ